MNAVASGGMTGRAIDHALSTWIRARSGSDLLARAVYAASVAEGQGHACALLAAAASDGSTDRSFSEPEVAELRAHAWVGAGASFTAFVLDDAGRFYAWRMYRHEAQLAAGILARCGDRTTPVATEFLRHDLAELFSDCDPRSTHWQRAAVAAVPGTRFFVLTGGPGTGKTTTVLRMLLMLLRHAAACGLPALPSVALAAPTGKAAQRLAQAIGSGKENLRNTLPAESGFRLLLDRVAQGEARTLHRLLGFLPQENRFRHGADNPLAADIVVVDEASMADLALMRQLVDALRPGAVLILLGDPDQLASVDAGSVLADIVACATPNELPERLAERIAPLLHESPTIRGNTSPLAGHVIALRHVWRAGENLGRALGALRAHDRGWIDAFTGCGMDGDVQLLACAEPAALRARVDAWIAAHDGAFGALMPGPEAAIAAAGPSRALDLLRTSQILCALREGPFGAEGMNALITRRLAARYGFDANRVWYHGRAVIITQNDYARGLFNGDVGVALDDGQGLRVWFETSDRVGQRVARAFSPRALPAHASAWAITIHRSQGSEYDDVAVVLPPDAGNRALSRELVYTAVSRARLRVEIWATADSFRAALDRPVGRNGGLIDRLGDSAH